jgi:hydrogenase maturation protease
LIPETLVLAWGNPSRGDDALGPRFVECLEPLIAQHPEWGAVECLTDFQLQVEHALDLRGRRRVLFVDASREAEFPLTVAPIAAARDASFTSHAMSPQAVLQVWHQVEDSAPPPCWLLAIRGTQFELGEAMSEIAHANLNAAMCWAVTWLGENLATLSTEY